MASQQWFLSIFSGLQLILLVPLLVVSLVEGFVPAGKECTRTNNSHFYGKSTPVVSSFLTPLVGRYSEGRTSWTTKQKKRLIVLKSWGGDDEDDELVGSARVKACIPYILPLLDGDQFGSYMYERIPILGMMDDILLGFSVQTFQNVPFLGIGLFLLLSLGTMRNTELPRVLRFNAQQAILIDVALIIPQLFGEALAGEDIPRYLMEPATNLVYYSYMSMILYSITSNLRGKKPDSIPFISIGAETILGPF
jgi:hypothetical protein